MFHQQPIAEREWNSPRMAFAPSTAAIADAREAARSLSAYDLFTLFDTARHAGPICIAQPESVVEWRNRTERFRNG
jgi:hypothetical protein